jgi:hypothetical protein
MTKNILGVVPGLMGVAVMGEALKTIPKDMGTGYKPMKMKNSKTSIGMYGSYKAKPFSSKTKNTGYQKQTKSMVKGMTNVMVGTALVGATASMIK